MSKKKPLVLWIALCGEKELLQHPPRPTLYAAQQSADYAEEYQHCGPHRIIKLQEVRSR